MPIGQSSSPQAVHIKNWDSEILQLSGCHYTGSQTNKAVQSSSIMREALTRAGLLAVDVHAGAIVTPVHSWRAP